MSCPRFVPPLLPTPPLLPLPPRPTLPALRSSPSLSAVLVPRCSFACLSWPLPYYPLQVGDLSRDAMSRLSAAKDRAAKLLALPSEVDTLKQIVLEQQILLNSLTKKEGSQEQAKELLALTGVGSVDGCVTETCWTRFWNRHF